MLKNRLQADQIQALKNHDSQKLEILRYILAQIQNKEIAKQAELSEEEEVAVLKKIAKELQETLDSAKKNNRPELINQQQYQLDVLGAYLPKQLSDEALRQEIEVLINKNKDLYSTNPKAIIGLCMKELASKADPSDIMAILKEYEKS